MHKYIILNKYPLQQYIADRLLKSHRSNFIALFQNDLCGKLYEIEVRGF